MNPKSIPVLILILFVFVCLAWPVDYHEKIESELWYEGFLIGNKGVCSMYFNRSMAEFLIYKIKVEIKESRGEYPEKLRHIKDSHYAELKNVEWSVRLGSCQFGRK